MRFRASGSDPPTVLLAELIHTPPELGRAAAPFLSSPMTLPATVLLVVPAPSMTIPNWDEFPEITFPSPVPGVGVRPPTVFWSAPLTIQTPRAPLAIAPVPAAVVP